MLYTGGMWTIFYLAAMAPLDNMTAYNDLVSPGRGAQNIFLVSVAVMRNSPFKGLH